MKAETNVKALNMSGILINNGPAPVALDATNLNAELEKELEARLKRAGDYDRREISAIEQLDRRLFPKDFKLSTEQTNSFRALCKLSQVELKPARAITSHRKVIGPLIVLLKRLSWPIFKVHLKDTVDGLQEFCAWSVYQQAQNVTELCGRKEGEVSHEGR
jgi:hypothetical protein